MRRRKNMAEVFKFVYVKIILIFLFFLVNGVSSGKSILSSFSLLFFTLYIFFRHLLLTLLSSCFCIIGKCVFCFAHFVCKEPCEPYKGLCINEQCRCYK